MPGFEEHNISTTQKVVGYILTVRSYVDSSKAVTTKRWRGCLACLDTPRLPLSQSTVTILCPAPSRLAANTAPTQFIAAEQPTNNPAERDARDIERGQKKDVHFVVVRLFSDECSGRRRRFNAAHEKR